MYTRGSHQSGSYLVRLDSDDQEFDIIDAASSPDADRLPSPPPFSLHLDSWPQTDIPFVNLEGLSEIDETDQDYSPAVLSISTRRSPTSNDAKAEATIKFMHDNFNRLTVNQFMEMVFKGKTTKLKETASLFLAHGGHMKMMDMWWERLGGANCEELAAWVVKKASEVCVKEVEQVTTRASRGPHKVDVDTLRVAPQDVSVEMVNQFSLRTLDARYNRMLPHLQTILKATLIKDKNDEDEEDSSERHKNEGRTLITSMLLNLRSRRLNYHAIMNSLILWDFRAPKRLIQMLNHLGFGASPSTLDDAIKAIRKDSIQLAQQAANDPQKIKMLPYDNINWSESVKEATVYNKSRTHDEVSAFLMVLPTPEGRSAEHITNISNFASTLGTRHDLTPSKSLADILPSKLDHEVFRQNAITHVLEILCEGVDCLSKHRQDIPTFSDPSPIDAVKAEQYYLPTFDQEQGSTRGNMVVLEHYFTKLLRVPKERFEREMFTILGDRLTTARDRAAQDQRSVDRSAYAFDHLSSFQMVSGLMHMNLNFIEGLINNYWGSTDATDPVSLQSIRSALPNRDKLNPRKVDYYDWLRFLDVTLQGLVIKAAMSALDIKSLDEFGSKGLDTMADLQGLAIKIVDTYILPSTSRLEDMDIKTTKGNTVCGHAVLLARDLMTLREMEHAIKHGHPTRVRRIIKMWVPMFYASGRYNYAHECMELLHNFYHDWPTDYAKVAFNAMFVNPSGKQASFKPTDIHVEHFNARIKERTRGSNATPELLEKITPIMGHVRAMTNNVSRELGVEARNQHHAKVSQKKDIEILVDYFIAHEVFNFSTDKRSEHTVADLFRVGCDRLSGSDGGHAKHLTRHKLRLRRRHGESIGEPLTPEEAQAVDELRRTRDIADITFTFDSLYEDE